MSEKAKVEIHLDAEIHKIEVDRDETILDAALKNGIDAPYSCMSGTCNSCQATLTKGEVYMEEWDALTEDEVKDGEILTCQAKPRADELVVQWPE